MSNKVFTPENISKLKQNEVFVFGSNKAGNHVGGAARVAVEKFGAIMGHGEGLQGQSYAIPTLAEYGEDLKPVCVRSAQIDGKSLKEDVFYQLKGGEFVEAAE